MQIIQFLKDLFMMKYIPQLGTDASFGLLFIIGLLTSFHCVGMCGGIILSQTLEKNQPSEAEGKKAKHHKLKPTFLYNLGRVVAYTFMGGIIGGLGQVITFTGFWKGIIPIFGGLFMVIMGINLLGLFPALRRLNIRMPAFAAKRIIGKKNNSPLYVGLLTGLMPCGPLQIMQLYALGTRSILFGGLSMLVFSLGTVPLLFTFGALNSFISKKFTHHILKVSATFVIILGFVMMSRGFALSGIQTTLPGGSGITVSSETGIAKIEGKVQVVSTSILSDSYPPILVQKGIPVQWTINATAENFNECNNAIIIPKFNMEKKLQIGKTFIEFTPEEAGNIGYSCWMGMIKSKIIVVDDINNVKGKKELTK